MRMQTSTKAEYSFSWETIQHNSVFLVGKGCQERTLTCILTFCTTKQHDDQSRV